MQKLKSIIFVVGLLLLLLSATMGYLSIKHLSAITPVDSYEDKGVYTFLPYQVLPVQVQNTGTRGRNRRMNSTQTVYMVYYRATDGSGYQWTDRAITHELGQEVVDAGAAVEPEQTAGSYTAGYITALALAGAYILLYVVVWGIVIMIKKSKGVH